ncbi:MAG: biotin/lipoyl-containing protein, partial [Pikeienuella sp.]
MSIEIRVPPLGESVTEATVAKWLKKAGDAVAADEPLVELETDKVSVEVPAPAAGRLDEILAQEGETVGRDALLAMLTAGAAGAEAPAPKEAAPEAAPAPKAEAAPKPAEAPAPKPAAAGGAKPKSEVLAEA